MAQPTNTQFALAAHLLTLLAKLPDRLQDSTALAISPATNPAHVRRVLGHLRRAGLVVSHPGAHGGWELTRPPATITLADVHRAVNGEDPVLGLHLPDPSCPTGAHVAQVLREVDLRAHAALLRSLAGTTIADLLDGEPSTAPPAPERVAGALASTPVAHS